jgi:hypothetical protein
MKDHGECRDFFVYHQLFISFFKSGHNSLIYTGKQLSLIHIAEKVKHLF